MVLYACKSKRIKHFYKVSFRFFDSNRNMLVKMGGNMLCCGITDRRTAVVKAYERMGVPHLYSASFTDPIILGIFSVATA